MHIRAVKDEPTFSLLAALEDKEVKACRSMLRAAGIELKGKIPFGELCNKLSESRLTITQRLQIKAFLARNHLIEDLID
jgi:hypothetical protein